MLLAAKDHALFYKLSNLDRKTGAVHLEIIGKLDAVERDVEFVFSIIDK